jgi:cation-transporting P-type ATPase D
MSWPVGVGLVLWDLFGHLPLPLEVAGHEGSTILVARAGAPDPSAAPDADEESADCPSLVHRPDR